MSFREAVALNIFDYLCKLQHNAFNTGCAWHIGSLLAGNPFSELVRTHVRFRAFHICRNLGGEAQWPCKWSRVFTGKKWTAHGHSFFFDKRDQCSSSTDSVHSEKYFPDTQNERTCKTVMALEAYIAACIVVPNRGYKEHEEKKMPSSFTQHQHYHINSRIKIAA